MKNIPRYLFWSGGADSTCALIKGLEDGLRIDKIFFSDTGMEFPEMYEYVAKVEAYIKRKFNRTVHHFNPKEGKGYGLFSRDIGVIRGKEQVRGIPRQLEPCWLQRNAKIRPFEQWLRDNKVGEHLIYIGYTADELKRAKMKVKSNNDAKLAKIEKLGDEEKVVELLKLAHTTIKNENAILASNHLYPLVMWDIDSDQTKLFLQERGILNPLYKWFDRTGCFMCPKMGRDSYYILWKHYPEQWEWMKEEERHMRELNAFGNQFNKDFSIGDWEKQFESDPDNLKPRDTTEQDFCFCLV